MASDLISDHGFQPLLSSQQDYRAIIFSTHRTKFATLKDLEFKTIEMPGPLYIGTIMGMELLVDAGLVIGKNVEIREVQNYDTVILDVLAGRVGTINRSRRGSA